LQSRTRFQKEATMAIDVTLHADEATRTPERGCRWTARATLPDGRKFDATARTGAAHELARVLVAANVADCALVVRQAKPPLPGHLTYASFHKLVQYTLAESATAPLRRVKWRDPTLSLAGASKIDAAVMRNAENGGEGGGAATRVAAEVSPPKTRDLHLLAAE
jgi:hypothetical protein